MFFEGEANVYHSRVWALRDVVLLYCCFGGVKVEERTVYAPLACGVSAVPPLFVECVRALVIYIYTLEVFCQACIWLTDAMF